MYSLDVILHLSQGIKHYTQIVKGINTFLRAESPTKTDSIHKRSHPSKKFVQIFQRFGASPSAEKCVRIFWVHRLYFIWLRYMAPGYTSCIWLTSYWSKSTKDNLLLAISLFCLLLCYSLTPAVDNISNTCKNPFI